MARVFGRYELIRLLGKGGMGEVFEARDREHDRLVAVKVLASHLADDGHFVARFRREARLAAQLTDPHVVPIHDFGEIDGQLYIDMRLIVGQDLSDHLAKVGPLPAGVAVDVLLQVASALDAAHESGLVHRDVKAGNIMLTRITPGFVRPPFAYLLDFGIARSLASGTKLTTTSSSTIGTLAYMAPERITGDANDPRSDVYALACVLFEALTGTVPFAGEPASVLYGHLHGAPPTLGTTASARALDAVIARGMARSPADRFQTAGELAAAAAAAVRTAETTVPATPASGSTEPATSDTRDERITRIADPTRRQVDRRSRPDVPPPRVPNRSRRRGLIVLTAALAVAVAAVVAVVVLRRKDGAPAAAHTPTTVVVCGTSSTLTQQTLDEAKHVLLARGKALTAHATVDSSNASTIAIALPGVATSSTASFCKTDSLQFRALLLPAQAACTQGCEPAPLINLRVPTSDTAANALSSQSRTELDVAISQYACGSATENTTADFLLACSADSMSAYLLGPVILTNSAIRDAQASKTTLGQSILTLTFTTAGQQTWGAWTTAHNSNGTEGQGDNQCGVTSVPCSDYVALVFDGQILSVPLTLSPIAGTATQFSGNFTAASARTLAQQLRSGALPTVFRTKSVLSR